jgi:hypothetical protein
MISGLRRLGLVVSLVLVYPATNVAWAQDDDEEEEDEGDEEEEEEEEEEDDEGQPPVTAGGLFTKETYPVAELQRPLTITKGMTEIRAGIDIDARNETAFENFGIGLDARYGIEDNVEAQLHFRSDINAWNGLDFSAAIESSIVYDLVDFRLGVAIPVNKVPLDDPMTPAVEPGTETQTLFDFELGFPFRYAVAEQGGIVALDTLMTINTKGKPDATPSIGILIQPVPVLAIKLHAKLIVPNFNFEVENFVIPVSANIQFSVSNLIDIGGEFTFPNLKPPDPDGDMPMEAPPFYDDRFLLLYGQFRL